MANRFSIETVFKSVDRVTAPVRRMGNNVGKAFRRINRAMDVTNKKLKAFRKNFTSAFGIAGAAGAALALRAALGAVIMKGAEFEQVMVSAGQKFGGIKKGTEMFERLEEAARTTGALTEHTATQAGGALLFMAKAGFTAERALAGLSTMVDFATASELELARASDVLTDSMGAFGLTSENPAESAVNMTRIADVFVRTANSTNTSMEQLFGSMVKFGPIARDLGIELETASSIVGNLAGTGIKAEESGVALRNAWLRVADPKIQRKIQDIGVKVGDANGNMRDTVSILGDINKKTSAMGNLERLGTLSDIFGKRSVTSASNILRLIPEIIQLRDELDKVKGETEKIAQAMRDTRLGNIKELASAWESVQLSLSKVNDSDINSTIKSLTELTRGLDKMINKDPDVARMVGQFGTLAILALLIAGAFTLIAAGITAIVSSTTGLLVLVGLIGAAIWNWLEPIENIRDIFKLITSSSPIDKAVATMNLAARNPRLAAFLEWISPDEEPEQRGDPYIRPPMPATPEERAATIASGSAVGGTATVTIKDETGKAVIDASGLMPGLELALQNSGGL